MNFNELVVNDNHFDEIAKKGFFKIRDFKLNTPEQLLGIEDIKGEEKEPYWESIRFITLLLYIHQRHADKKKPFGPMIEEGNRRTIIPSDITKEQAEGLFRNISKIESPIIKSKLADILWECRQLGKDNITAAKIAIQAYNESVDYLLNNYTKGEFYFLYSWEILERLSVLVQFIKDEQERNNLYKKLLSYLSNTAILQQGKNSGLFVTVFRILSEINLNTSEVLEVITALNNFLQEHSSKIPLHSLRSICESGIIIARKKQDKDLVNSLSSQKAETYVAEANARKDVMGKVSFLRDAIIAYNGIPDKEGRIESLKQELASIRPNIQNEMANIELKPIDVRQDVENMSNFIGGVSLEESIIRWLSYFDVFPTYEYIVNNAKNEPVSFAEQLFPISFLDEDGNVTYQTSNDTAEEKIEGRILKNFRLYISFDVQIYVRNGIILLYNEHSFTLEDIQNIISNSPFIPKQNILIFSKAFYYFLRFEMLEAVTLLIPQIENSLRHILSPLKNTDVIRADGRELSVIDIERLLSLCKELKLLTDTESFYLETILCHPVFALRHVIAHGKAKDTVGNNMHSFMMCFLIFYLSMRHKMNSYYEENPSVEKRTKTIPKINKYIEAMKIFISENKSLFESDAHEITLMSQLARTLQKFSNGLDIDIEYNRDIDDIKRVDGKPIKPYLIIHKLGDDSNNILVCEAKKIDTSSPDEITKDKERIKEMTSSEGKFHYRVGCFLLIDTQINELNTFWYENRKEIANVKINISN